MKMSDAQSYKGSWSQGPIPAYINDWGVITMPREIFDWYTSTPKSEHGAIDHNTLLGAAYLEWERHLNRAAEAAFMAGGAFDVGHLLLIPTLSGAVLEAMKAKNESLKARDELGA
jgi:hypothetical protein